MSKPEVKIMPMILLPPASDACQVCATQHLPELPHNRDSLYYQMSFHATHQRWPTWEDAMSHCSAELRDAWLTGLAQREREKSDGA